MQYVEGIGSFGTSYEHNDFYQLIGNAPLYSDVHSQHLVCVSKYGQLLYQMNDEEMEHLGAECLCQGVANSVEEIQGSQMESAKFIYNNQLLIQYDGKTYNITGAEVGE